MKILVLNGPNLNLLGQRDPAIYGTSSLAKIEALLEFEFPGHLFTFLQSNHEGELIDALQRIPKLGHEALIANFGGFSHTSVAIRDALELVKVPKVEVHLSNIHARESFRHHSITAEKMDGLIAGFGPDSYVLGVKAVEALLRRLWGGE